MRALLALSLCLALGSCSRLPVLLIINNSGAPIEIFSVVAADDDGFDWYARGWPRGNAVASGSRTHALTADAEGFWRVRMQKGRCRLWYFVPSAWDEHVAMFGDTIVQLEPDERLYLVTEREPGRESYRVVEADGYPLRPARNSCWATEGTALKVPRSYRETEHVRHYPTATPFRTRSTPNEAAPR